VSLAPQYIGQGQSAEELLSTLPPGQTSEVENWG